MNRLAPLLLLLAGCSLVTVNRPVVQPKPAPILQVPIRSTAMSGAPYSDPCEPRTFVITWRIYSGNALVRWAQHRGWLPTRVLDAPAWNPASPERCVLTRREDEVCR